MVQVAALTIVVAVVWVVAPRLRVEVRILALISELLLELLEEHELVEVLLSMLHLLGLTRPRVEAAELLQVVAIAAHVLKLLICSELVHLNPVGYVLVLGAKCTVSDEAGDNPSVAQVAVMEEILLVLPLVHE